MVILSDKQFNAMMARLDEQDRLMRLQGEAHSALMNQAAATQQVVRDEAQKLHERISFNRRTPL